MTKPPIQTRPGDIVVALFPFRDEGSRARRKVKPRPALVWAKDGDDMLVIYMTSSKLGRKMSTEVVLDESEARSVGLNGRSKADFAKRAIIGPKEVGKVIGSVDHLSPDLAARMLQAAEEAGLRS